MHTEPVPAKEMMMADFEQQVNDALLSWKENPADTEGQQALTELSEKIHDEGFDHAFQIEVHEQDEVGVSLNPDHGDNIYIHTRENPLVATPYSRVPDGDKRLSFAYVNGRNYPYLSIGRGNDDALTEIGAKEVERIILSPRQEAGSLVVGETHGLSDGEAKEGGDKDLLLARNFIAESFGLKEGRIHWNKLNLQIQGGEGGVSKSTFFTLTTESGECVIKCALSRLRGEEKFMNLSIVDKKKISGMNGRLVRRVSFVKRDQPPALTISEEGKSLSESSKLLAIYSTGTVEYRGFDNLGDLEGMQEDEKKDLKMKIIKQILIDNDLMDKSEDVSNGDFGLLAGGNSQ